MAGEPASDTSTLPAAAHVVGDAFVNQYYNILHESPEMVHQFYKDASRLTRAEAGPDGAVDSVFSQSQIHEKVMALDNRDFKAEITTVDSQDSLTGGVLVTVTGSLCGKLTGRRNFVQSFFLAPQERGYFVLNDIFRYLDEDESQTSQAGPVVANGLPVPSHDHVLTEPETSLPAENGTREVLVTSTPEVEPMVEEIFESAEQIEALKPEDDCCIEDSSRVETAPVIDEPPHAVKAPSGSVSSIEGTSKEAPKNSSGSNGAPSGTLSSIEIEPMVEEIFESAEQVEALKPEDDCCIEDSSRVGTAPVIYEPPHPVEAPSGSVSSIEGTSKEAPKNSSGSNVAPSGTLSSIEETSKEAPKNSSAPIFSYASMLRKKYEGPPVPSITHRTPKVTAPPVDGQASNSSRPTSATTGLPLGDGRSVYVKNLPLNISASQLEEELRKFGRVKAGGVNLKNQNQGVCFAFVEFEKSASAQTAIGASPIPIGGRRVYIEEKRPMGPRPGGRGSRLPGTGRSDRAFRIEEGLRGRETV